MFIDSVYCFTSLKKSSGIHLMTFTIVRTLVISHSLQLLEGVPILFTSRKCIKYYIMFIIRLCVIYSMYVYYTILYCLLYSMQTVKNLSRKKSVIDIIRTYTGTGKLTTTMFLHQLLPCWPRDRVMWTLNAPGYTYTCTLG